MDGHTHIWILTLYTGVFREYRCESCDERLKGVFVDFKF